MIAEQAAEALDNQVCYFIVQGWQPFGAPTCMVVSGVVTYSQTLVKYVED